MLSRAYHVLIVSFLLLIFVGTGCNSSSESTRFRTLRGFRSTNKDFTISDGNVVAHDGKLGVMFGTVKVRDEKEKLTYFVVFKHSETTDGSSSFSLEGEVEAKGRKVEAKSIMTLNGNTIETAYQMVQADDLTPTEEFLSLGGKAAELDAGRLFFIDYTASSPTYKQVDAELGTEITSMETAEEMEALVKRTMESLKPHIPVDYQD